MWAKHIAKVLKTNKLKQSYCIYKTRVCIKYTRAQGRQFQTTENEI